MKLLFTALVIFSLYVPAKAQVPTTSASESKELRKLFDDYGMEFIALYPVAATSLGFNYFNDQLPAEFTDSFKLKENQ